MNNTKPIGTFTVEYAHQVRADTRANKPFEMRAVEVRFTYFPATWECPVDNVCAKVETGEFAGLEFGGDDIEAAAFEVRYGLMSRSRDAFEASMAA